LWGGPGWGVGRFVLKVQSQPPPDALSIDLPTGER
jgi:hypothetical protein